MAARELSIIELSRLVAELSEISGFYIDKFYETGDNRFRIRVGGQGKKTNLNIELPYYAILSNTAEVRDEATNFTLAARKKIDGAMIKSISLYNRDRIIRIELGKKDGTLNLLLEMFGQGNMIITDSQMKISLVYRPHEFEDRSLRKDELYVAPKNDSIDFWEKGAIEKEFEEIKQADKEEILAVHLSRRLGIGTLYIRDAIMRLGLPPKTKIKDMSQKMLDMVMERIVQTVQLSRSNGNVVMYVKANTPIDIGISELAKYSGMEFKHYTSLSKALEVLYSVKKESAPKNVEELERLKQSIEKQVSSINGIQQESAESKAAGEWVSSNTHQINQAISYMKVKKDATEAELASASGLKVKKIDRKRKLFTIDADSK